MSDDQTPTTSAASGRPAELAALDRIRASGRATRSPRRRRRVGSSGEVAVRDPMMVGDAVEELVDRHGWDREISVAQVAARWSAIVGDQVAAHCQVEAFADGQLTILADSSSWATQMKLLLPQLTTRIETMVGPDVVESITIRGPAAPSWKRGRRTVQGPGPRDTYG